MARNIEEVEMSKAVQAAEERAIEDLTHPSWDVKVNCLYPNAKADHEFSVELAKECSC